MTEYQDAEAYLLRAMTGWVCSDMPGLESDLRETWLNGMADWSVGDVDYGPGHYFQVKNFVMRTDSHGFEYVIAFGSVLDAQAFMGAVSNLYQIIDRMNGEE